VARRCDPDASLPGRRALLRGVSALALAALPGIRHGVAATGDAPVSLYVSDALARYGFPEGHPLGMDRQGAFFRETVALGLDRRVNIVAAEAQASRAAIESFHTRAYVEKVANAERDGLGLLDNGDTPVFPGVYQASATVVGAALEGLDTVMRGEVKRTFQPIGGLHHAGRNHAAGFCVFNDLGIVIETLRRRYGVRRVAYVDIDVHHGDGVYYAFEDDPDLIFADIHQDGRTLYPGTGHANETGKGAAEGTKLNIPLEAGAGDAEFFAAWRRVVAHLEHHPAELYLFQCGADGLKGDPLASLEYSAAVHATATRSLRHLADAHGHGRLMAFGGGGYLRPNLASAWNAVVVELLVA
jgi:acetoin utilization protein AcuC